MDITNKVAQCLLIKGIITGCILMLSSSAVLAVEIYEEGTHFVELRVPIRTRTPDKIEVTEYFSYGCPHCYELEPTLVQWASGQRDDVVFNRTPAIWDKVYLVFAQTYYTAEVMGVLDQTHMALFRAIHIQRRPLIDPESMASFFSEFGVNPVDFARVYNSFGVRSSVQQADARGRGYRADGVPAMIINGKFRVEIQMAGSTERMFKIVDYLIDQERLLLSKDLTKEPSMTGSE